MIAAGTERATVEALRDAMRRIVMNAPADLHQQAREAEAMPSPGRIPKGPWTGVGKRLDQIRPLNYRIRP
jgi:hypothetical protein